MRSAPVRVALRAAVAIAAVCSFGAKAAELKPSADGATAQANRRCAAYGAGYFAVRGSSSCIRISGYVSGGAALTAGPGAPWYGGTQSLPSGIDSGVAVSGDAVMDTPLGPGQLSLGVRQGPYPQSHYSGDQ